MAVFSRLATVFAISSLLLAVSPVAADSNALSHNKHPQARAAHHNHVGKRSSRKRAPAKREGKCKPKATTSTSVSTPAPTPTGTKDEDTTDGKDDDNNNDGGDNNNDDGGDNGGGGGSQPVGGGKAGLGWNNEPEAMRQFLGSNSAISWSYSWSPWDPNPSGSGIDFCPMMWGAKQEEDWWKTFEKNKKAKCVLGMNEPDRHDQGAIDPYAAAALWKRTVEKLPSSARRVSPAPAGGEEGFAWLHNFIKACDGCQIDAIGAHIYTTDIEAFKTYLTRVHNEYGRPVWVTEWACMNFAKGQGSCTRDQAFAFNGAAIDWMNSQWWIEKFAAFGSLRDMYNVDQDDRLMTADGKITDLGWDYIRIRN
ncbi:hypothetical protein FRC03_005674 [Tulasnella sp. 419]|nr:hypothetical protein FRC03_005674 [Tulasnella sp. 419]